MDFPITPQVDGIQCDHGQYTREQRGDTQLGMQQSCTKSRQQTGNRSTEHRQPGVHVGADHPCGNRTTQSDGTLHRQIRHIQDTVGNIDAQRHDGPEKSQRYRTDQYFQHDFSILF